MSGRHYVDRNDRPHQDPLLINRDPVVIERSPEETARRASSEPRRRNSTVLRIYNPFSRRGQSTVIVTERTPPRERLQGPEQGISLLRPVSGRERRSSPPPPPLIIQRSRSQSPIRIIDAMTGSGQQGFVPLPPVLPETVGDGEDATSRRHEQHRRRESNRSRDEDEPRRHRRRRTRVIEEDSIPAESATGRRSPRPYTHRSSPSDPYEQEERILEPQSRSSQVLENFEIIRPNETVRSRQRDGNVRGSREYIEMKALAERNFRAAEDAVQRCSSAEVRLQNLQAQLADMTMQQNRANEIRDKLERELDETRRKLEECQREHRLSSRERDSNLREVQTQENRLEIGRQRDRDSSSNERRRRPRIITIEHDGSRSHESEPRSHTPRASTSATLPTTSGDAGMDAIERARAEAAAARRV